MRHVLTRQQLHDMIWERAVSKVAPELGISDVALRKRCIAHAIPLPGAVYWGRRNAGKKVDRTPLPPLPTGVSDRIVIDVRSVSEAPEAVVSAIADARAQPPTAGDPPARDRLVAATMNAARRAKPDRDWGAVTGLGPDCFQIRAHPAALDRLEAFLVRFAHAVRARGWKLSPGKTGLEVVVDGEPMGFSITQTIRRVRHVPTADERKVLERWDARHGNDWDHWEKRPVLPWWDFTHSGEMRLEVQSWPYVDAVARRFADTRNRQLDDRIDDILVSFVAHAAARKVERVRVVERQRQEEEAKRERARLERLARFEQARVGWLERKLGEQRDVEQLRRFMERLEADIADDGWVTMRRWALERLEAAEARLAPSALAVEVSAMEAFAGPAE